MQNVSKNPKEKRQKNFLLRSTRSEPHDSRLSRTIKLKARLKMCNNNNGEREIQSRKNSNICKVDQKKQKKNVNKFLEINPTRGKIWKYSKNIFFTGVPLPSLILQTPLYTHLLQHPTPSPSTPHPTYLYIPPAPISPLHPTPLYLPSTSHPPLHPTPHCIPPPTTPDPHPPLHLFHKTSLSSSYA